MNRHFLCMDRHILELGAWAYLILPIHMRGYAGNSEWVIDLLGDHIFLLLFVLQHLFFPFHLFYKPFLVIFFPKVLNKGWVFMTDRLEQLRLLRWAESTHRTIKKQGREGREHSPNLQGYTSLIDWIQQS